MAIVGNIRLLVLQHPSDGIERRQPQGETATIAQAHDDEEGQRPEQILFVDSPVDHQEESEAERTFHIERLLHGQEQGDREEQGRETCQHVDLRHGEPVSLEQE